MGKLSTKDNKTHKNSQNGTTPPASRQSNRQPTRPATANTARTAPSTLSQQSNHEGKQEQLISAPSCAGHTSTPDKRPRQMFSATPTNTSSKYCNSQKSLFTLKHKDIPEDTRRQLEELGAHSLTNKTWSSYNTAKRMLAKCCKQNGIKKELPVKESTILIFIHWLATVRKLKTSTINNYLAGIRQLHISHGLPDPSLRSETVNLIIKGAQHKEARDRLAARSSVKQPITTETMLVLKAKLREWEESSSNHRLIWAVATNLFHGLFRIGELTCDKEDEFDPAFTLLTNDICVKQEGEFGHIQFQLKAPKEDKKQRSKIVDVYGNNGPTCPVRALTKWKTKITWPADQPAFRWDNGLPLTARKFNRLLKELLGDSTTPGEKAFSSHCFRIGAASRLGNLGYSDEDVKAMGRWSSRAFEEYLLHPRTKRAAIAKATKNL
jgi:hypothetical protein